MLWIGLLAPVATWAQQADSLVAKIDEVVVTGTRTQTEERELSQPVTVIDRRVIERSLQPSLLSVLTERVPGLFTTGRGVLGYGVSGGAAGGLSIRGLSGGSGQMMVLIDGHPQYMGLMGHPISDAYQSFLADKVEVVSGPASVLYGSNAMGGVVNILTRKLPADGVRTNLLLGGGSYGTMESELTNLLRKGRFYSVASLSYNRTDGHRRDMGFEQYGGYVKLGYTLSAHWEVSGDVNITHFNASQPGSVQVPLLDADQRVTRGMTSLALRNHYGQTAGAVSVFYNWGNHWINDGYTADTSDKNSPKPYRFDSEDYMTGVSVYQSASLFKGNTLTVGLDYFRTGGKAWNRYVEGEKKGDSEQLVDKYLNEVAGYAQMRQQAGDVLTLEAGVRADSRTDHGVEWVPQAGVSFHLPHAMELKASVGKGFRYPTIREMYMFPPQNPALRAESLWSYELAFSGKLWNDRLSYGANVYYIDGKDLIQTLPNPAGAGMLNQNTGRIYNSGVEGWLACRLTSAWQVNANYSFLHMARPVVAAPQHKLNFGLLYEQGRWMVSTNVQYIHGLYTSVTPFVTENYTLWNLRGSFRVAKWLRLWCKAENLLAQRYETMAGYPMPRATVMAGVQIKM